MRYARRLALAVALALASAAAPAAAADWRQAQQAQLAEVFAAVEKYRDVRVAEAEGWRPTRAIVPLMGQHWARRDQPKPMAGDQIDFSQPGNLMYSEIDGEMVLLGVAFVVQLGPFDPLPEGFAGPEDVWHVHNLEQIMSAVSETRPLLGWIGRRWVEHMVASPSHPRLAMVHVWLDGRSPDGVFSDRDRSLPYRRLGIEDGRWANAPIDASFGLAMAHPEGCEMELRGKLFLSGAGRSTRAAAYEACAETAERVRAALGRGGDDLEAYAADAWQDFQGRLEGILSPAERRRIASIVEAGCGPSKLPFDEGPTSSSVKKQAG